MSTLDSLTRDPKLLGEYVLSPYQSSIAFKAKSLWGLLPVRGKFTAISGHGALADGGGVSGQVIIDAASVSTGIDKRDQHLRSADFFDAANFPQVTVTVHRMQPVAADEARFDTSCAIKDVTKDLTVKAAVTTSDLAVRVQTVVAIDRADFAVCGNLLGMVGDRVVLHIDLAFNRTVD